MQERVSNEDIRIAMRLNPVLEPFLLDLLDARKERDEARKALLWYGEHDCGAGLPDFVVSAYEAAADAARAAGEGGEK